MLVETSHPGNIGAAARAMKTMGLSRLVLVNARQFPDAIATARAAGADDILEAAQQFDSLEEALAGCVFVAGTSARLRSIPWPLQDPREGGRALAEAALEGDVAIVFGRERNGLSNAEMDRCQRLINIPSNPDYSSLNLGSAVQVLSYEFRMAALDGVSVSQEPESGPATHDQVEGFFGHLERVLDRVDFLDRRSNPELLMRRLRRLFNRAGMDENEVNIWRGILVAIEKRLS